MGRFSVNDYLARRDAQWMGPLFHMLGLSVGVLQGEGRAYRFTPAAASEDPRWPHLEPCARRDAYAADVTYGTNGKFGLDYLRDHLRTSEAELFQRPLAYAIVDEVDSVAS